MAVAAGTKLARGRITIIKVEDGADVVKIYTRSQFQPSTPVGTSPAEWNAAPSSFDSSYWALWVSTAIKNADGSFAVPWSKPILAELYESDALVRFPFTEGIGAQSPFAPYSSTDNIREKGLNPFGISDVLWRGKSQIGTGWCGGFCLESSKYVPVDTAKRYRFSCWFKRNTWSEGNLYFGVQGAVQTTTAWSDSSNFYFWNTGITSLLQANKWYLVVGYVYPSDHTETALDIRTGVYDPVSGNRVVAPSSSQFCRHKQGVEKLGIRISQYNCPTTNPEVHFWQPRIDLCDSREPSIEELLKKTPIVPSITISGESVFKFATGQSVPSKTSLSFTATLRNSLTTYQWQYSNGGAWANISGATASSYSLTYNYSAWGSNSSIRIRCISTLAGVIYYSNEITVTKVYDGAVGPPGVDANLLDWVSDWNSAKTVIGATSVITPKIFAGVKNANNTVTGVALGRFSLSARNDAGTIITETIDGIYGFRDGYKTFFIDSGGNAQLGRGNQSIKYNAVTGKIEFGSEVALAWVGATYIDANGIFTGTLSADTVNAININASQITTGTISAELIDVESLKATLITAENIDALTLNVTKGKIGGWSIDADSIFRGTKNNTSGAYTSASGAMTIGSNGIRGYKWRLDSTGAGAVAGGNISWDASGNVTFADSVALSWNAPILDIKTALGGEEFAKMTHITSTGIYTGTLTASQITAGTISADRIAAGSITASKLDAASIKADIINVGYINGLSCTFTKGTIGGWTINSGSISNSQIIIDNTNKRIAVYGASSSSTSGQRVQLYYNSNTDFGLYATDSAGNCVAKLGSANQIAGWNITNTQISKNSVVLGADGSIVNGTKWKLNNDGSGQIANGNISWSAAGVVTFSSAVSLAWTTPINNINTALGGTSFTKLTYISSTGIYTGTLTATQVNAVGISASSITTGTLNADRIASGSITSVKLDAASIKSNIINTDYINGLSCTFVRGTIGGFTIGSDNMSVGSVGTVGQTPIQIRTSSIGSGYWYSGAYKPFGICMTWYQSSNAGHIVLGQIAASGNSVKSNFIGLQMMSWDGLEYFCLSTNYTLSGSKQVYNRIAGWGFDSQNIWKNSVYLGSDGSIYNGTKWRLDNSGSGRLANGNIVWDSSGNVTFGASVSLNWTNAATNALNQAKTYADTKKTEAINAAASDATTKANAAKELASAMAYGRMLYRDPTFYHGTNSTNVYNNAGNGTVSITRVSNSNAPNDSKMVLRIQNTGTASPECGGFYFGTTTSYRKIFIARIIANIPTGRSIGFASNSVGSGGNYYWLTPTAGTGDWCEYVAKVVCGTSSFSSTNFFYITGATGVTWDVAYATVFDVTSVEKMTTTIDANGIYTGTLNANQITAGTIDATRINTEAIKSAIITATNINALTLTTTKGSIGGWSITSTQISKNSVALSSDGSIVNGTKWRLNNDGSGQLANGNISWDTAGNITARNAMFNNVRIQGSVRNPFVLNDSSIWVGGDTTNQQNFNNYDNIVPVRGSWNELINLPWTLQNSGRRVVLVNYKWNSTITQGFMDISAPSGKYFYEDGIAKSRIQFSREVIELLGYGDNVTFFGWIVLNRHNIMTDSRYGKTIKILAQGRVTGTSSSASITYKTFDNTSMSVSRIGEGKYRVYYSSLWGLSLSNAVFNLTGYGYSWGSSSAPIKASVYGVYSSYFDVNVSDDASNNDGSFYFQIANMNDWTY